MAKPYHKSHSFSCHVNVAYADKGLRRYTPHAEGRAIRFAISTWPCGEDLALAGDWVGHPTCKKGQAVGRARNDLGDQLALWLAVNANAIGVEYLVFDRTAWSRRSGWHTYARHSAVSSLLHSLTRLSRGAEPPPLISWLIDLLSGTLEPIPTMTTCTSS